VAECPVCGFDCKPAPDIEVHDTYPFLPKRPKRVSQDTEAAVPKGKRRGKPKNATVDAETSVPAVEKR
jgi:hypothetical protein